MSKFLNPLLVATTVAIASTPALAEKMGLGRPALPEEVAAWDLDVSPDGTGLPKGSGSVEDGEMIFSENCAVCHGEFAEGVDNWPKLAGGFGTLANKDPVKTVGSFWPHLSTTWDYVNRSMPFGNAQSLAPDQVYAIVAYILYSNDLVEEDFVLSNENFTAIAMPNTDGFFVDDREAVEAAFWAEPCMENCKDSVEITMEASVLDVTPEGEGAQADTGDAAPLETAAAEPAAAAPAPAAADPALIADGEAVFKKCKACHQVGEGAKNKTGPELNGVIGRHAATLEGFKYSKQMIAFGEDGGIWDEATLSAFLTNPKAVVKGTKMSFAGLKKEEDIQAILAYLGTFPQ